MKNSKSCPKCSSTEIYTNSAIANRGDRSIIPVSSWTSIYVQVYACTECGYFEEYLNMKDKSTIDKLKTNWKKA